MPFGINLQPANSRPASLQAISSSLFGNPLNESQSGFFAGLPQFLKFAGTAGTAAAFSPNSFASGGSNNSMEIPNLPSLGGFKFPPINFPVPNSGGSGSSNSNDYLKWLLPILAGVSGGLDNRAQKTTTTPTYDSKVTPLRDTSIESYMKMLTEDPNLTGYQASQTSDINHQSDIQKRLAEETLASKGVYGPAVGSSLNSIDANRFAAITKLKQGVPLLSRQLQNDTLSSVGNFLGQNKGTQIDTSGNVLGGALGGTTELLAYLYGLGKI